MILRSKIFFLLIALIAVLTSCVQVEDIKQYSLEVKLNYPEALADLKKDGLLMVLTNLQKGTLQQVYTDEDGKITFSNLEPGVYSVSTSIRFSYYDHDRIINGYKEFEVNRDLMEELNLNMADISRFVISQFYYSGYLSEAGKLDYSDQFIEIYNNSADTLYADGLSIVEHESSGGGTSYWKDWEPTHIVVKAIWTIPGNGSDVPVFPGKSLVIASNALDHQSDPNGSPNSPVNLGGADFEYHVWSESGRDIDYPNVPNLVEDLFVLKGTVSYFDVRGGSAMALVWLPEDHQSFIQQNMLLREFPNATRYYCKIPNEWVEDAVEVMMNDVTNKRFAPVLDAGSVAVEAGSKSGLAIRRKVEGVFNGRKVLKDTNNSTNDFEHDVVPVPRYFELN